MTLVTPDIAHLLVKSALAEQEFFCKSVPRISEDAQLTQAQLEKIRLNLWPKGQPQERVFSLLAYLVYYGRVVLDQIIQQTDVFDFRHRILYFME